MALKDNQLSDVQLCDVQLLWQPALVTSSSLLRPALCDIQLFVFDETNSKANFLSFKKIKNFNWHKIIGLDFTTIPAKVPLGIVFRATTFLITETQDPNLSGLWLSVLATVWDLITLKVNNLARLYSASTYRPLSKGPDGVRKNYTEWGKQLGELGSRDVTKAGCHKSWTSQELVVTRAGRHVTSQELVVWSWLSKSWLSQSWLNVKILRV